MKKTQGKLQFFIFWKIALFLECFFIFFSFFSFFFIFLSFFIIFHHFSSFFINSTTGSKNDKKMIKKNEKTRGKLHFFIFRKIFEALEAKMMKHDKKMKKMKKKWKNEKNSGKIAIFHFLENCNFPRVFFHLFFIFFSCFHHFSSFFISFHQFHHRKQKW